MTEATRSGSPLERLRQVSQGTLEPPPVSKLIGFRLVEVEAGRVVMEMHAGPRHTNPMGTVHGGILCDLSDAAMGMCYASQLQAGESFTTLELKTNFLKPVWQSRLRAEARMIRPGRTVGLVECRVTDEKDSLVAHATSTCMTLRGEAAQGR